MKSAAVRIGEGGSEMSSRFFPGTSLSLGTRSIPNFVIIYYFFPFFPDLNPPQLHHPSGSRAVGMEGTSPASPSPNSAGTECVYPRLGGSQILLDPFSSLFFSPNLGLGLVFAAR